MVTMILPPRPEATKCLSNLDVPHMCGHVVPISDECRQRRFDSVGNPPV